MGRGVRTVGRVAALTLLALLLSACIKLDMDVEVAANDTVSGTVIFAVRSELLDLAGGTGSIGDILGSEAPLPEGVEGVTQERYEDDEFTGQQFTFDAVPLAQFNQNEDPDALRIERQGDEFLVSGVLDLTSGALSGATGATGLSGFDPSQFLQGAQIRIRISFPGEVTDANGDVDGNTVTWTPEVGERLELEATASAIGGGGDSNLTLLLIIGAAVVIAAIVIGVIVSRRRPATGVDDTTTVSPPGPPPAPPAPPPPTQP
jgi:hypothetical protein